MKKITSLLFCLSLLIWACNNESKDSVEKADSTNKSKMDSGNASTNTQAITTDEESSSFLVKAANGGMTEVQLGELAESKGKDAKVKDFAAMMVHDHSAANEKVKGIAAQRNVTLPTAISDENKSKFDDLSKKSGSDFDKAYMSAMVKDHQSTLDMFQSAADKVKDTDVKTFINNTIPTVKNHLDSAKAIQKKLK